MMLCHNNKERISVENILITGSSGFMGQNLCAFLKQAGGFCILNYDIENTKDDLKNYLEKADFIFHLAGVNRPKSDEEFDIVNRSLTQEIVEELYRKNKKTPIVMASSVQAILDNPYGTSKKAAEDILLSWSKKNNSNVYIYRLPNVFGKWSKPNYNSVVATFCHNIAHGQDITISDPKKEITLAYIDDVIRDFFNTLYGKSKPQKDGFYNIPATFTINLGDLAGKISEFKGIRQNLLVPDFENIFDRDLYATFMSFLGNDDFCYGLDMKSDDRGFLAEFLKSAQFGQIFISRTKPEVTRGNHYHHTKTEKFLVLDGEAEIRFRKINSESVITYKVSGEKLMTIEIPPGYSHSIKNTGNKDLITVFWADEVFDKDSPDTFYMEI
jgi:UDP-2-acetamido-2,6-beta-L-arabino-hexul-4-ose reductase